MHAAEQQQDQEPPAANMFHRAADGDPNGEDEDDEAQEIN